MLSPSTRLNVLDVLLFDCGVSLVFALKISDIFGVDLSLDMVICDGLIHCCAGVPLILDMTKYNVVGEL